MIQDHVIGDLSKNKMVQGIFDEVLTLSVDSGCQIHGCSLDHMAIAHMQAELEDVTGAFESAGVISKVFGVLLSYQAEMRAPQDDGCIYNFDPAPSTISSFKPSGSLPHIIIPPATFPMRQVKDLASYLRTCLVISTLLGKRCGKNESHIDRTWLTEHVVIHRL
jgi:hypothetical protein